MFINHDFFLKKYRCKKNIADYLVYKKHLPILSYDNDYFYFVDNDDLRMALRNMPMWMKVISKIL